jgi:NTE family protein
LAGAARGQRKPLLIDLALQGGRAHGAFTWGVLDRLLEEPRLKIDAISGTSAGAMNAAVLADGWTEGGAPGARAAHDAYWERVGKVAVFSPMQRSFLDRLLGRWTLDYSPAFIAFDLMSRLFSPYDLNPQGHNPLSSILDGSIDFKRLARSPIKLFVTATSVHTGRGRIFRNAERRTGPPRPTTWALAQRMRQVAVPATHAHDGIAALRASAVKPVTE